MNEIDPNALYTLADGDKLSGKEILTLAEIDGITPEEWIKNANALFEDGEPAAESPEVPSAATLKPIRFITYKNETIYEDDFLNNSAGREWVAPQTTRSKKRKGVHPDNFDDYAALMGRPVQVEDTSFAANIAPNESDEVQPPSLNQRVHAASRKVSNQDPEVQKDIADKYFEGKKLGASYEKAGLAAESSKKYELGKIPVDNRYETFPLFGNQKDLDDYNNYKKTGKFDIDLADPKLISGVLNEHKSRAQQLEARRASSSELQEAQDNIADIDGTHGSSARIKAQQKQDKRDYEAIYGEELYKITTVDGRTYVPPTVNITDDPRWLAGRQRDIDNVITESTELDNEISPYLEKKSAYETRVGKYNTSSKNIADGFDSLGDVDSNSDPATIEAYNSLIIEAQELEELHLEGLKKDQLELTQMGRELEYRDVVRRKKIEQIELSNIEYETFSKDYSKANQLGAMLEAGIMAPVAMFATKAAQFAVMANYLGSPEGSDAYDYVTEVNKQAVNYNERLQNQISNEMPMPLTVGDKSTLAEWVVDATIQNSPSLLVTAATTLASGGIGLLRTGLSVPGATAAAQVAATRAAARVAATRFANLQAGAFFAMEGGSKIAEMEIGRKNAPMMISALEEQLSAATSPLEKARINKELEYHRDALDYSELQIGFTGLMYGGTAAIAEKLGATYLLKNIGKMSRSYGSTFFKQQLGEYAGRIAARSLGIGIGGVGAVAMEQAEEGLTLVAQNLVDMTVLGEDKNIFDGYDLDFVANVAISSMYLSGGGMASNLHSVIHDEFKSIGDARELTKLKNELTSIQGDLSDPATPSSEKQKLKDRKRQLIKKAADLTSLSVADLSEYTPDQIGALLEANRKAKKIRQDAESLAANEDAGSSYNKKAMERLEGEYSQVMNDRESSLTENRKALEKKALDRANIKTKDLSDEQAKVRGDASFFTPSQARAFAAYRLNLYAIKNTKGIRVVEVDSSFTALEQIEKYIEDNPSLSDKEKAALIDFADRAMMGANNSAEEVAGTGLIIVNHGAVMGAIAFSSDIEAAIASVAPLHELAHKRGRQNKIFVNDELAGDAKRMISSIVNYAKRNLTADQYKVFEARLNAYQERAKAAGKYEDTNNIDADEVMQLLNDFVRIGALKGSALGGLHDIKAFVNSLNRAMFGDKSYLFGINSVQDALQYIASYSRRNNLKFRAEEEEDNNKASINVSDITSNTALKLRTQAIYEKHKSAWVSGNKERKALAAMEVLDQSDAYMALMKVYADRPQPKTGASAFKTLPGFDMEYYLIIAKSELSNHIINFNTAKDGTFEEKNDNLHGWINAFAYRKALGAVQALGIDNEFLQELGDAADATVEMDDVTPSSASKTAGLPAKVDFLKKARKLMPTLISNDVLEKVYEALSKFVATSPKFKFEKRQGSNSYNLSLSEQKLFREELSIFLEKELTKYLQKEVVAIAYTNTFAKFVRSSFGLYNLIPQNFINMRIDDWKVRVMKEDGSGQVRESTYEAGKELGAVGKGVFDRKDITEAEWVKYWDNPAAGKSTKSKLKERFAAMIASGMAPDMLLNYLNETNDDGDLVNLQEFLNRQGLPSVNEVSNFGIVLTEALQRDPAGFNLKYSINLSPAQAGFVVKTMPNFVDDMLKQQKSPLSKNKIQQQDILEIIEKYDKENILGEKAGELATIFFDEFANRLKILSARKRSKTIQAADNKNYLIQTLNFITARRSFANAFGVESEYLGVYDKNGEKIKNGDNQQAVIAVVDNLLAEEVITVDELVIFLSQSFNSGLPYRIFNSNLEFYEAFKPRLEKNGFTIVEGKDKDNNIKYNIHKNGKLFNRGRKGISGPAYNNRINKKGQKQEAVNEINESAKRDRAFIEKLINHFNTLAPTNTASTGAANIFAAMSSYTKSPLRGMAGLVYVQDGIKASRLAVYEHALPAIVVANYIGAYLNKNNKEVTKEVLDAVFNGYKGALIAKSLDKKIGHLFRQNMPSEWAPGSDTWMRYNHPLTAFAMKDVTFKSYDGKFEDIKFSGIRNVEFAAAWNENALKSYYTHFAKGSIMGKASLNTSYNIEFDPNFDGDSMDPTSYTSDTFKVGKAEIEILLTDEEDYSDMPTLSLMFHDVTAGRGKMALTESFKEDGVNPLKVFAGIGNAVADQLKAQTYYSRLTFQGDGMSRASLYSVLGKKLADNLGWNYTEYIGENEDAIQVVLERKEAPSSAAKASINLNEGINYIIEQKFNDPRQNKYSDIGARQAGRGKGRFNLFVPPRAEDFMGLLYSLMGSGKEGDAHRAFFEENLMDPYVAGIINIDRARQSAKRLYSMLLKENPDIAKLLKKKIKGTDFTYDQALRVYLWKSNGIDIPGLSEKEIAQLNLEIMGSPELLSFVGQLKRVTNLKEGWPAPSKYWTADTLLSDIYNLTEGKGRQKFLKEFIANADIIFSPENMNKLRANLGNGWADAMLDSLYRMKNGTNRPSGSSKQVNAWNNWVNRSTGAIMFFNRRSAVLQLLSTINFINWGDNNPLKAAAAFANQPQYWSDWAMIFNSPKLKERRGGLRMDVSESEIANEANGSSSSPQAILAYLLKIGFTPTQIADSFAIASGGATFYRNRVNTYKNETVVIDGKKGRKYTDKEAEEKAWKDFSRLSDSTQQSSDPSLISQEQASVLGRLILTFQNTAGQYTRRGKKAILDLAYRRGDPKENISRAIYYLAVQNAIFSSLQGALFALIPGFDDDEEETFTGTEAEIEAAKAQDIYMRALNSGLDTILKGSGISGAVVAALKNTVLEYIRQQEKKEFFQDDAKVVFTALSISPPIGSKASKFYGALRTKRFEKDVIAERGLDLMIDGRFQPSPLYSALGKVAAAGANIPLDRVYDELTSISEAFDERNSVYQRIALSMGYKNWQVGATIEEEDLIKVQAKAIRKADGIKKAKTTRAANREQEIKQRNERLKSMSTEEWFAYQDSLRVEKQKKKDNKKK